MFKTKIKWYKIGGIGTLLEKIPALFQVEKRWYLANPNN